MADNAPERDARWLIDTILLADWPTMLRKNGAPAAYSSDFCSYYTLFYRRTSIILAYFWLDLLADHAPEYVGLRIRPLYSDIVIKQEGDYSNVYNAIVICPHFLVAIEHHILSEEICGVM